ncbi:MAG TPA: hypothetical protein DFR83_05540 [Deltaproteobacteria bacterium]|nr:hypothetical protein [Deltaproteobacteria bacterium]
MQPVTPTYRQGNRVVAAAAIGILGTSALYWFDAGEPNARHFRASDARLWHIANHPQAQCSHAYALGGDDGNQELARFKPGHGRSATTLTTRWWPPGSSATAAPIHTQRSR